jgi:hypothetical protein
MQLILAIDSDPRRSEQLAALVRARLEVDLVQATSAGEGLHALKERVPDLILTSPLLSPFDDGVLDEYLRELGGAATHVQTLRIPVLSTGPRKASAARRLFSLGRRQKPTAAAAPDGCDPKVFADEIAHYLTRSMEQRSTSAKATAEARIPQLDREPVMEAADTSAVPGGLVEEFMGRDDVGAIDRPPTFNEPAPVSTPLSINSETSSPYDIDVDEPEDWKETAAPEPPAIVEPGAARESVAITRSENSKPRLDTPAAPAPGTSASFEAALAAIRAAWVKPDAARPATSQPAPASQPKGAALG